MAHEDQDNSRYDASPASEYIAVQWREAMRASREGMEAVRRIWPELTQTLPESASVYMKAALDDLHSANRSLHLAGRYVLGEHGYADYLDTQALRQIEG